ncbi:DNA-binding response regulator [Paenibacillus baekrokdamisoli]|uniref:DNA-binding response regulator n=1 Tax=Paenibacillus baekrokdamisoli TaxID=1712516 RepID=A0A3G9JJ40_9BACL|nr:response regulator [Paenibacillus baekrokdamisoli]MBB3067959.1 two-component SAPR family response regulator [Paenibacillus baekrokdamisoli]BBH22994.1 DNA-binding response regulator [Paenibacillus baekrokdamisoli]
MKVLIIDDEKAMHLIMKRMLAKVADVEVVESFLETAPAFSYLANHEVDLVFVDISMPRENGLEFAERLRESGRHTKLVFITSHKEYALFAFDVYAFDYIVKPVNQERLQRTVQRALTEMHTEHLLQVKREPASSEVEFKCLGGIDILSTRGVRVKWKSSKSAELFGYLLIHKGRLVSRSRLIEDIFGDMPLKNAEIYLNTTVYQLRKVLETYGLKESLLSDSNHYALSLDNVRVDLLSFEEGCRQMSIVDEIDIQQAMELEQLYMGDLFGDRAFSWAWNEIERLSLMYTSFTQRLCVVLLDRGETNAAIRLLMKLLVRNELDEESHMLLMKALALQKNKEALTRQYLQFAETLHKEMRINPSLEVAALYGQLLSKLDS